MSALLVDHPTKDSTLLAALLAATLEDGLSFGDRVASLLKIGSETLQLPLGIVARIEGDDYTVRHVLSSLDMPVCPGDTFSVQRTYCLETLTAQTPVGFHHAAESEWATHPAYADFGLEAYLGCSIRVDGEVWGTLNFSSPAPRAEPFRTVEHQFLGLMAQWLGQEMSRQHLEQCLQRQQAELAAMHEASPLGMFLTDENGYCLRVNRRYQELSGLTMTQCLGTGWSASIHPEDRQRVFHDWHVAVRDQRNFESDHRFLRPDETVIWSHVKAAPMVEDSKIVGYVGTVDDVTEQRQMQEELRRAAMHDSLTGLPNRQLLTDRYNQLTVQQLRSGHLKTALLVIDFDGFKAVNDNYGHRFGDLLLTQIAKRLNATLRATDTIVRSDAPSLACRTGGDEFVILLGDVSKAGAEIVTQRLLHELSRPYPLEDEIIHVTASIGVALRDQHRQSLEELQHKADLAMYAAKQQGKNRSIFAVSE